MKNSKIEWTDDTCNPIIVEGGGFYCVKVSEGCKYCYAEIVNKMTCGFNHVQPLDYKFQKPYPKLELKEGLLAGWAKRKASRKIFVSSMTDVFGEFVPVEWVYKILDAMIAAPRQIFQVLTKRGARMRQIVNDYCDFHKIDNLPKNIWLIVSVENQDVVSRAVDLIATRCEIRGLSIEPLLGDVNLTVPQKLLKYVPAAPRKNQYMFHEIWDAKIIEHMDWVIVGGESGGKARVMNPEWAYSLQRQCKMYDVPFFFKQWGEWVGGKYDRMKGKVMLEDDGIFWTNPGHPPLFNWQPDSTEYWQSCSARVGKKVRQLPRMGGVEVFSDNGLFFGRHFHEFPKYLKTKIEVL